MQVLLVDEAVPVLVNHVEGLLELLDLGLVEHGKHVGGGALRALLSVLALGPFARHVGDFKVPSASSWNAKHHRYGHHIHNITKN